jgi:hypothetical protein
MFAIVTDPGVVPLPRMACGYRSLVQEHLPHFELDGRWVAEGRMPSSRRVEALDIVELELPHFRGRLAGRDHLLSAVALASYSMGER